MLENEKSKGIPAEVAKLNRQIEALNHQIKQFQQEKTDLEILLETATEHSDVMLEKFQREKTDLEILLETTTEHSDVIESELQAQAEEARRQTEEQFRLIAEATPVTILISHLADHRILYANKTTEQMFRSSSQKLLECKVSNLYLRAETHQEVLNILKGQFLFQGELQLQRIDGTTFWALASLRQFLFKGETTILTALYDITDRKQAEEALRLAEENYRSIFNNALEGIFQTAPDGKYININPAMARILGYTSPEDVKTTVLNIRHIYVNQEDRDAFEQLMDSQGKVQGFEYQIYRHDGSIVWVSESARSVRDSSGVLLYYEGIVEEITQRKQEEERLRQQVHQLQVEIDQNKRARQVAEITQTDYFQKLLEDAEKIKKNIKRDTK